MPDQNDLSYNFDSSTVLAHLKKLVVGLKEVEKQGGTTGDSLQEHVGATLDYLIKSTDKARQSQERYVRSIEQTAAAYGKTGVEKLIAQRDQIIKRLGDEQKLVEKVTQAYAKMIEVEQKRKPGGGGHGFSSNPMLAFRGVKDLFEGRTAYGEVMLGRAAMGFAETAPLLTGIASGIGAIGVAAAVSYVELGKLGVEIRNISLRTGLSTREVGAFSFAAEAAGADVGIFERMMRGLTQATEDQTQAGDKARAWLTRFGVDVRGVRDGTVQTSTVFKQLAEGVSNISNPIERAKVQLDLFKRLGIESIPVMMKLNENLKAGDDFGKSDETVTRMEAMHQNWTLLKTEISEAKDEVQLYFASIMEGVVWLLKHQPGKGKPGEETGLFGRFFLGDNADPRGKGPAPGETKLDLDAMGYYHGVDYAARFRDSQAREAYEKAQGPEYRLKTAEHELSKAPYDPLYSNQEEVANRKEELKYFNQHKATVEALRKLAIDEQERISHPFGMLPADRQLLEFSKMPGGPNVDQAQALLAPLRAQQAALVMNKAIALGHEGAERAALATGFGTETTKSAEDLSRKQHDISENHIRALKNEMALEDRHNQEAAKVQGHLLEEVRRKKMEAEEGTARLTLTLSAGTTNDQIQHANAVLKLKLDGAQDEYTKRKALAEGEYAYSDQLEQALRTERIRYEGDVAAARREYDETRAREVRNQLDSIKQETQGLLHTLFTNPAGFGGQLKTTLRDAALKPIEGAMSETISRALHPTIFGETGTGGIAGGLRGIFGGNKTAPIGTKQDPIAVQVVNLGPGTTGKGGFTGAPTGKEYNIFSRGGTFSQPLGGAAMMTMLSGLSQFTGIGGEGGSGGGSGSGAGQVQYGSSDITGLSDGPVLGGGGEGGFPFGGPGGGGGQGMFSTGPFQSGGGLGGFLPGGMGGMLGGGGTNMNGMGGMLGSLKGLTGMFSSKGLAGMFQGTRGGGPSIGLGNGTATTLGSIASSPIATMGGFMLAQHGLMGGNMGTKMGMLEGAAGGALIGFAAGGPIGAAIGAGVGFGIGLGEVVAGVEPKWKEATRLVQQQYRMTIGRNIADQIVAIAKQSYGGTVSIAVRSPEVREMLGLYAAGTGQAGKVPMSGMAPHGASLISSKGSLYQAPTYQYGNAYGYQSSMPVYGGWGNSGGGGGQQSSPTMISMHFDGKNAGDAMTGQFVTPSFVQGQTSAAWNGSRGRVQDSLMLSEPGTISA